MIRVCLDSTVFADLSDAVRLETLDDARRRFAEAAIALRQELATRDVQIVIPAPAYSEALSSRARQERVAAIATLRAPVVPLDAHSAEIAADLHLAWRLAHPGNMNQDEKSVVRIDAFIAGIAVQRSCDLIVSRDVGMAEMARPCGVVVVDAVAAIDEIRRRARRT